MRRADAVRYPKRVKKGRAPRVAPAEVVEAPGRQGMLRKASAEKETSASAIAATMRCEDTADYPKRVKKVRAPGVAPAEVVEAPCRQGTLRKTSAEKETSAAAVAATVRREDAVDYSKRVKKDRVAMIAPVGVVLEAGRQGASRMTSAEKETYAAAVDVTMRREDAVDYLERVKKGRAPRVAPVEVV